MKSFEFIASRLKSHTMTFDEKRHMRAVLSHYATTHPVKSGLVSPYTFRYIGLALTSLVVVLGGSIGLTTAAGNALPTDSLYPIKLFVEEYQAKNQKTPEEVIAFETKRIETRFDEATRLAINHKLDDATALVIQSGIEHSRNAVTSAADSVQNHNPELALAATGTLETSFSSNSKILAAIERTTNQSLGTIVLAAQVTSEKIATEKAKYEHIVAMKPNDTTKITAETKLAMIESRIPKRQESTPEPVQDLATATSAATLAEPAADARMISEAPAMLKTMMVAAPDESPVVNSSDTAITASLATPADETAQESTPKEPDAYELLDQAKQKMADGKYSEALVILGQVQQLLDEQKLTESLEQEYSIETESLPQ